MWILYIRKTTTQNILIDDIPSRELTIYDMELAAYVTRLHIF